MVNGKNVYFKLGQLILKMIRFVYHLFILLLKIIWIPFYRLIVQSDTDLIVDEIENTKKHQNKYEKLDQLLQLKQNGVLTEEEFKAQKEKILKD